MQRSLASGGDLVSSYAVPMSRLTSGQALAVARAVACDAMPYFRAGLLAMVPRAALGLGTFGVTKGAILLYDPEVLAKWTPREAAAVLLHEYLHLFLRHAAREEKLRAVGLVRDVPEDRRLVNVAADVEINCNLEDAGFVLPVIPGRDGQLDSVPATAASQDLPPWKLMEEYVVLLLDRRRREQEQARRRPDDEPQAEQQPGWGRCGSAAGNPLPDEPAESDPEARSEVDQQVSNRSAAEAVERASGRGNVPLGLLRSAKAELAAPKVPWKQKFGAVVRGAVACRRGTLDYTFTHRSRRQSAIDMVSDPAPILPAMVDYQVKVAFVADTSISIGDREMNMIVREAAGVLDALPGARVTFVACDAAVHTMARVRSVDQIKAGMKGGGGTDFRPAFEALARAKPRPDVIVFATDGYGCYPSVPPKAKVIWLNVGGEIGVPWGEVIDVELE